MSDESLNNTGEAVEAAPEAEDTAVSADANPGAPTDGEGEPPEDQTFKQDEVNKIVAKELAKAERRWKREQAAQAVEVQRPIPSEEPRADQYETPEEFFDALTTHKAAQMVAHNEHQKRTVEVNATYAEREEAAREAFPDFQQVVYRLPADGGPSITLYMAEVIKGSEMGPDVAYHLGKNIPESRRIARLSPLQQAVELGKIEASLKTSPPPVKKTSAAPPPVKPVTRSSTPTYDVNDPRSVVALGGSKWIEERNRKLRQG